MSNVEFEEDFKPEQYTQMNNPTGMTGWLLKKGIIKDESQSKMFLLGLLGLIVLITLFVLYKFL